MSVDTLRSLLLGATGVGLCTAAAAGLPGPVAPAAPGPETVRDRGFLLQADARHEPGARRALPMPRPLPPVETMIVADSEFSKKKARKAWFRELHRTAPGTDEAAVFERENGRQQLLRRNAARAPAPPPPAFAATWQERGSDNQAGRSHSASFSPDGTHLYIGSALGGVWRGRPDGSDWEPLGDGLYGGAHQLIVSPGAAPGDPDILLAAARWSQLHVSTDDGATWEVPTGLPGLWQIVRLARSTDEDAAVWAIIDNGYGASLSRSLDGGQTFTELRALGAPPAGPGGWDDDLWAPRDGDGTVYLVADGVLERSHDGGESWERAAAPDPEAAAAGTIQQLRLVGSEAGAPTLYAAVTTAAGTALHRSDDAGDSWQTVDEAMDDFWGALAASMVDDQLVVWGGIEAHRSTDGGASSAIVNAWGEYYGDPAGRLHADIMGLDAAPDPEAPDDPEREVWFANTDGGTYISRDGLATVQNLSLEGLRISQYYDVLTSAANPAHVAAGAQDQGYQITQGLEQDDAVLQFAQVYSGDYGHLTSGDGTHETVFSVYPGFLQVRIGEDDPRLGYGEFPAGATMGWLPMVVADPQDPEAVFLCADQLYRFEKTSRGIWTPAVFGTGDFAESEGEHLSALAFAPTDPDRAYGATNRGRLFTSSDGAETWTLASSGLPAAHYFYGTALVVDPLDPDRAWAGGAGYDNPPVLRTTDGGATWEDWSAGLPATLVYSLVHTRDGSGIVVAGTETGAWARGPDDEAWVDITGSEAPVTIYWGAEALAHENTVRFATYGRGIWDWQRDPPDHCYPVEDADGDGASCIDDCDDGDADRSPGAEERCGDGIDQDCDGADAACPDTTDTPDADASDPATGTPGDKDGGCAVAPQDPRRGGALGLLSALGLLGLARRRRLSPEA